MAFIIIFAVITLSDNNIFFKVNVKYEDLPKFLKVAESMQIKGLHTEVCSIVSTSESNIYFYNFSLIFF